MKKRLFLFLLAFPLLLGIFITGQRGETAVPTNMANGQDEADILENIDPRTGFALRDEKDAA